MVGTDLSRVRPLCRVRGMVSIHDVVDWLSALLPILPEYNRVHEEYSMSMETDLIHALDTIAFEKHTTDEEKLASMQNLLYQFEQIQTAKSLQAEENTPNMRRV